MDNQITGTHESPEETSALKSVQNELNALKRKFARLQKENDNLSQLYKQAAALRDFNEREKETQMRYNQMLRDNSPDDILLLDKDLNILLCTASVKRAFGRDITGEPFLEMTRERFGEEYTLEVEHIIDRMLSDFDNPSSDAGIYEINVEVDGERKSFYSITLTPALDNEWKLNGVVVLAHDNTEIHEANVLAEAANKAKSSFLSTMSHEIRTPMNAILGITEIQLQNESLEQPVQEALGKIYSSGELLLGIINDILDLSKIEAGKLELIIARYETASLINDTSQLNMMRIGSKPIEFLLNVDEKLPASLMGDELRVKQILNNLLSNAFKYTAEGTVTLSVLGQPNEGDETLIVFEVSDTGQGMTEDQVAKLFDEYSRFNMEANRTTEGTGLGMSITKNLIKLMNGEISVKSEPGKGSAFTVALPQDRIGDLTLGREVADNLQQFRSDKKSQMNRLQVTREPMPYGSVLIVDDVETNIYVAKGLMTPYGLKIDSADSGRAAIDKVRKGNVYDIIFMDHMMPGMDGIEATGILREEGYKEPIVALTANAVAGQAEIFLESGFDDFISKPIDLRQLNKVLNSLVRDKQTPETLAEARKNAGQKKDLATDAEEKQGIDPHIAEVFLRDAVKSLAVLDEIIGKRGAYSDEDMRAYVINIHGMKSALANIGETELSAVALNLEQTGRNGDKETIASETPLFLDSLRGFIETIKPEEQDGDVEMTDEDMEFLREKLTIIKDACDEFNEDPADAALAELRERTWEPAVRDLLGAISEHLLHSDFDEVVNAVAAYLG